MEGREEFLLLQKLMAGEVLEIDGAGVIVVPSADGHAPILLSMIGRQGKRHIVPLSRDLALMLGEQMVRAVDAIDAGLAKID